MSRTQFRVNGALSVIAAIGVLCGSTVFVWGSDVVSPARERALALSLREDFLAKNPTLPREHPLASAATEAGTRVAAVSDRPDLPFAFYVLENRYESAADQAVSLTGGTVAVTRELIERFRGSDDRLAFVVGHEVAHVALRHHLSVERMARKRTRSGRVAVDEVSLHHEFEADRYGALYLVRAGYRFGAALEALEILAEARETTAERPGHPTYATRLAELAEFQTVLDKSVGAFDEGLASLEAGRSERAIDAFGIFVQQFPDAVAGRVNLGTACLVRLNELEGSPGGLDEPLPLIHESGVEVRGGSYDDLLNCASRSFRKALAVRPAMGKALIGLSLVRIREGSLGEAESLLTFAESTGSNRADVQLAKGNVRFIQGDYDEAAERYGAAADLRAAWPSAKKNLALAHAALGDTERAVAAWRTLETEPRLQKEARWQLSILDRPE